MSGIIVLSDQQKGHLGFLASRGQEAVENATTLALRFALEGAKPKAYTQLAQMLQADPNAVRLAVEALSFFFVESAKKNAGSLDFIDSALLGGFDADVANYLYAQFQANVKMLRTTLGKMSMELPQYHNLEWRLDVQVASRSLHRQLNPTYLVQLDIKDGDAVRPHLLQTDPASLNHLTQALETALNEMKTAYARRIVRNIK